MRERLNVIIIINMYISIETICTCIVTLCFFCSCYNLKSTKETIILITISKNFKNQFKMYYYSSERSSIINICQLPSNALKQE